MERKAEEISLKENAVRNRAKEIENKLLLVKEEKLNTFRAQLKEAALTNIQRKYEAFKS